MTFKEQLLEIINEKFYFHKDGQITSRYDERLKIARQAYKEINEVIRKFEDNEIFAIRCCWDECIQVDDELFQSRQLKEE